MHGRQRRRGVAKEYLRKTTGPHQMWATDSSYFKVIGWSYYYLVTVMDALDTYWPAGSDLATFGADRDCLKSSVNTSHLSVSLMSPNLLAQVS